jgi:hypothetical protein
MDVKTARPVRRSTRIRVHIPVVLTSMDRRNAFSEECVVLIASPQGCGMRCSCPLAIGTPIMLSNLPNGASITASVANCLPLGTDGSQYLIGASLYNHGNCWGIANPPADWAGAVEANADADKPAERKDVWPYNLFSSKGEAHPGRR